MSAHARRLEPARSPGLGRLSGALGPAGIWIWASAFASALAPTLAQAQTQANVQATDLMQASDTRPDRQPDRQPARQSARPSARAAQIGAQLRLGLEVDDNPLRAPGQVQEQADAVARYFASLDGAYGLDASSTVVVQVRHGGKRFYQAQDADTLLTQASLSYQRHLPYGLTWWVSADAKDRTERVSFLDYHSGGVASALAWRSAWAALEASAGWRYFAFKPNNATGTDGPLAALMLRAPLDQSWQLMASYTWLYRRFDVRQLVAEPEQSGVFTQTDQLRRDHFHVMRLGASWRGPVVLDGGYVLSLNRSNSAGQALQRHSVELTMTAPLGWGLLGSAHAELLRTTYEDPFLIDANFLIDEDNRNSVVLALARPLGERWDVEARYSVFTQEFGGASDYRRQTLMIALGCQLE